MIAPILVALHTRSNTGYAIAPLEQVFLRMSRLLVEDHQQIHFSYKDLSGGRPTTLPPDHLQIAALDLRSRDAGEIERARAYVQDHSIRTVFAFDAPVSLPVYGALRTAGVERILSYQGAPMSSLSPWWKLVAKRLEVRLHRHRPDHFIFESEAMRDTAVLGRGIPRTATSVVRLGVDSERFHPRLDGYAAEVMDVPPDRLLVVYSGHMEPRKGVHVLISAFVELVANRSRRDLHLLILGNKPGQADRFHHLYAATPAAEHITFGGYRNDIADIFGSADIGVIASTGWDSFTMSSVEMAASGLPLIVSALQGLVETVDPEVTGFTFPPGDVCSLADRIELLADDAALRDRMGKAARARAIARHSVDPQVEELVKVVRLVCSA